MPFTPPDWSLWVARIKAEVPTLQVVGTASDFQVALQRKGMTRPRECYVVPGGFQGGSQPFGSQSRHTDMTWRVGVFFSATHYHDPTGERGRDEIGVIQAALWAALIGWEPVTGAGFVSRLVSGQRWANEGPAIWWRDIYQLQQRVSP